MFLGISSNVSNLSSPLKLTFRILRPENNLNNGHLTDSTNDAESDSQTKMYQVFQPSSSDCSSLSPLKGGKRNKKKKKKKSKRRHNVEDNESPLNGAKRLRLIVGNDTISIDIKKKLNL